MKIKDPSLAWKIGLLPGMGQFYNNQYLKGALLLGLESKLIYEFSFNYLKYAVDKRNDITNIRVKLTKLQKVKLDSSSSPNEIVR